MFDPQESSRCSRFIHINAACLLCLEKVSVSSRSTLRTQSCEELQKKEMFRHLYLPLKTAALKNL